MLIYVTKVILRWQRTLTKQSDVLISFISDSKEELIVACAATRCVDKEMSVPIVTHQSIPNIDKVIVLAQSH